MPIPKRRNGEKRKDFLSRCMSDGVMNKEYPEESQRYAVCQNAAKGSLITQVADTYEQIKEKNNNAKKENQEDSR